MKKDLHDYVRDYALKYHGQDILVSNGLGDDEMPDMEQIDNFISEQNILWLVKVLDYVMEGSL